MRDARITALLGLFCLTACSAPGGISSSLASRAVYAPSDGRLVLELAEDGTIEEAAVPATQGALPAPARTAIERERPGGHVTSVHRIDGARGVVWRVAKVVLGEAVEYESREDGEILSRAVALAPGTPAWDSAAAASARVDPGGEIRSMSYVTGPLGRDLVVTKTVGGAPRRLRLRARGDDWEKIDLRRVVDAEIRIGIRE